jgi:hypothetical protein
VLTWEIRNENRRFLLVFAEMLQIRRFEQAYNPILKK